MPGHQSEDGQQVFWVQIHHDCRGFYAEWLGHGHSTYTPELVKSCTASESLVCINENLFYQSAQMGLNAVLWGFF